MARERRWTQTELAIRLGLTTAHAGQLVSGQVAMTEEIAVRLERVFGASVQFLD
jgi:HTH-type transcriptional regulator/antitoxin HigA